MANQLPLFPNLSKQDIIHGDCLDVMKTFADNHFTSIITDPPYGIAFMGKNWDKAIPSQEYWKEMLRIIKPGGHLISAGLPRMLHRLTCAIEDSGWEIRDLIMHLFGSGFPKSHNHFGFEGYGTALKPAWEGWILAMKPLEGTFKQNAEKHGVAGINIEATRVCVPTKKASGRWPANIILEESFEQILCLKNNIPNDIINVIEEYFHDYKLPKRTQRHIEGTQIIEKRERRIEILTCDIPEKWLKYFQDTGNEIRSPYSAAQMLDEQSGNTTSIAHKNKPKNTISNFLHSENEAYSQYNDSGGASRFFYCAKASSSERNKGLEGMELKQNDSSHFATPRLNDLRMINEQLRLPKQNNHPTVKPLKLMEYLIKLIAPPKDALILDPFAGSGSTILAAKNLDINAIGIEKNIEYCQIAKKRIE
jgi:DNA modification methylase